MIDAPLAELVGADIEVPLLDGSAKRFVNLDYAASTPAMREVAEAVDALLPWYSSVHRGAGWKSRVATAAYEDSRQAVAEFVGARADDVVVLTGNTTDALNILAHAVPPGGSAITFDGEHHANLLPWRRMRFAHLPVPASPGEAADMIDEALSAAPDPQRTLVSVAGASNVTGELWPVAEIASVVHEHGARLCVDAAQLAPHAPIDMAKAGIDYLALSGHKLYAPYGSGALVGRRDWLDHAAPFVVGGGAVRFVTHDDVAWADAPCRLEAGSPNVVGAAAMGAACRALARIGMDKVAAHEDELGAHLRGRLAALPAFEQYTLWAEAPRIAVVTGNLQGVHHGLVAAVLSAEHAVGVRDGCFCAHPLLMRLLSVDPAGVEKARRNMVAGRLRTIPGAVRISAGLGTTARDLDAAIDALAELAERGPGWDYCWSDGRGWEPEPDTRPMPSMHPGGDRCRR